MANRTKENNELIEKNLKYLDLALDHIPEELLQYDPIDYRPTRGYSDKNSYKVYQYVDVRDIQILLTPANRLDSLTEKYEKASPFFTYLLPENEEQLYKHTMFLNMLRNVKIGQIEVVEKLQEEFQKDMPVEVKYFENYLWQIYYSEVSKQYFMLVPTMDSEYACFFYLIKKKIECSKKKKGYQIFVPICNLEYEGKLLRRSEITELENYLWLYAKDWPMIYEVYDKKGNLSIQIVGEAVIYEKMKSLYKITLRTEEEATAFHKLLKALFILQTELPKKYQFHIKVNQEGALDFYQGEKQIQYEDLADLLKNDYAKTMQELKELKEEIEKLKEERENLKQEIQEKTAEYLEKEKEISTYLECRKSFFGKLKYYFHHDKKEKGVSKKKKQQGKHFAEETAQQKEDTKVKQEEPDKKIVEKPYRTIRDLTTLVEQAEKEEEEKKNIKLDIKSAKEKAKVLEYKIKNAKQYLDEIDEHKKSIFEFWRYTNKDNALALQEGREEIKEEESSFPLHKTFDYEEDFASFGVKVDRKQREILSKEECDAVCAAGMDALEDLNKVRKGKAEADKLEKSLEKKKEEAKENHLLSDKESYDIFGNLVEDKTKIKMIAGKKHREVAKNPYHILDITTKATEKQYEARLKELVSILEEAISKGKTEFNMALYSTDKTIEKKGFQIFHIKPEQSLNIGRKKEVTIYRVNLKEDCPAIFLSNIMYYDNYNQTLPLGMDLSDKVLLDMKNYTLTNKKEDSFGYMKIKDELTAQIITIHLVEYDLEKSV